MECRAYGICLDSQSRGYLGKDRKVSSAAGGNLSRMHKTQETAKESRLNFMYSHLRNRTLASPVYPAAFRRVIGVTGVTSEGKTYSGNSLGRLFRRLKLIGDWAFRGSYGPDGWFAGLNPRVNVDEVEAESGELRPYPIAAYTPNVPWLSGTNGVSLSGSGTSAATPQVAAAAALWLENHRREFGPG